MRSVHDKKKISHILNAWPTKTMWLSYSYLAQTCTMWNVLPPEVFPWQCVLNFFKKRIKCLLVYLLHFIKKISVCTRINFVDKLFINLLERMNNNKKRQTNLHSDLVHTLPVTMRNKNN